MHCLARAYVRRVCSSEWAADHGGEGSGVDVAKGHGMKRTNFFRSVDIRSQRYDVNTRSSFFG